MGFQSILLKIREWGSANKQILTIGAFLALGFLAGLGVGLLSGSNEPSSIVIDKNVKISMPRETEDSGVNLVDRTAGNFVASINGQAYYPKGCTAANRINEENKIWFDSAAEAESQGYKPAQNCR